MLMQRHLENVRQHHAQVSWQVLHISVHVVKDACSDLVADDFDQVLELRVGLLRQHDCLEVLEVDRSLFAYSGSLLFTSAGAAIFLVFAKIIRIGSRCSADFVQGKRSKPFVIEVRDSLGCRFVKHTLDFMFWYLNARIVKHPVHLRHLKNSRTVLIELPEKLIKLMNFPLLFKSVNVVGMR